VFESPGTKKTKLRRSTYLGAIMLLASCAAIHREQAPALTLAATTPVGFQSVVRCTNTYSSGDPRAIRSRFSETVQRHRTSSMDGTLKILALSGGGSGGAFGAGATAHAQTVIATGFDARQAIDPQLTPACPLDPSPIPFEGRTTLTSAVH
jgi:hypothetical protein